jgi:predicted PurR-regulated permease PerM
MWYHNKFFHYTAAVILILTILFLLGQINFFWRFMGKISGALFLPALLSGFLYYLFRPLLRLAEKIRIPTPLAILLLFLLVIGIGALSALYMGALASREATQFLNHLPGLIVQAKEGSKELLRRETLGALFTGKIQEQIAPVLGRTAWYLKEGLLAALAGVTRVAEFLIMIPFILFYLLRDHEKFSQAFIRRFPKEYRGEIKYTQGETACSSNTKHASMSY